MMTFLICCKLYPQHQLDRDHLQPSMLRTWSIIVLNNLFYISEQANQIVDGDLDRRASMLPTTSSPTFAPLAPSDDIEPNFTTVFDIGARFRICGHDAPVDIATRRTALINYLLVDMRFARLRYGTATTFLYSEAISDCIRNLYRMIVCVQRNINQLTPEDIQLHRTGDEDMESDQDVWFRFVWEDSYNDFLDSNGTVGALINWESVETSITDDVGSTLRSGNRSGVNQLFRRFVAAELEHQQ
ncbi:hypothetical protein BJV82DRAFT_632784 [Fennellomyces sp. T-0311]|nr:hypothetical protein BJV82DRAFT_632784 [Fennellomyces sp. T-0311]